MLRTLLLFDHTKTEQFKTVQQHLLHAYPNPIVHIKLISQILLWPRTHTKNNAAKMCCTPWYMDPLFHYRYSLVTIDSCLATSSIDGHVTQNLFLNHKQANSHICNTATVTVGQHRDFNFPCFTNTSQLYSNAFCSHYLEYEIFIIVSINYL